jgi:hypothetical protein
MKIIKVLLEFLKLPFAEKISFYRNVIAQLNANKTVFANPDSDLDATIALVDAFDTLYLDSIQIGGHQNTVNLHKAEEKADKVFKILANYVNRIADGDESIILLAGFEPSSEPTKYVKPELSAVDGSHSGTIKLVAKANPVAGAYIWQKAEGAIPTDEKDWVNAGHSTQANITISNCKVGIKHFFRFAAVTPQGVTDFCAPISKIVL